MSQQKLFTQEELKKMCMRPLDLIKDSADSGDFEKTKRRAEQLHTRAVNIHDTYRDWVTGLLSFIGRQYGDEVLRQALEESMTPIVLSTQEVLEKETDIRKRVRFFVRFMHSHWQPLDIIEDDEKFILKMLPCGSGGRMIQEGKYGPPLNYLKVKKAQPITYWKEDFPVYCCHGPIWNSIPLAHGRKPMFLEICSEKPGEEPCEFWLFKDPEAIPPEAYKKAGIELKTED